MFKKPVTFYAAWADIISGAVIVLTLIYAVIEFNRTKAADLSTVSETLYARNDEVNRLMVINPSLVSLVMKAEENPESLTRVERKQYSYYAMSFFDSWLLAMNYYEAGTLLEAHWQNWNKTYIAETKKMPLYAWGDVRYSFGNSKFIAMVDRELGFQPEESL